VRLAVAVHVRIGPFLEKAEDPRKDPEGYGALGSEHASHVQMRNWVGLQPQMCRKGVFMA
jgi:hypothetical protein